MAIGDNQDPTDDLKSQAPDPLDDAIIDDGTDDPTDEDGNPVEPDDGGEQDPAPEGDDKDPEQETKPINQEAVDKKIHKLTFEKFEEKRKREDLEQRLAKLEGKSEDGKVDVPPAPDPYDPDFEQKLAARDEAIKQQAEINARATVQQKEAARAETEKIQKDISRMYADAEKLGIKESELKKADDRVAAFITSPEVAQYLLSREDSAQLVSYLSGSPAELDEISQMSPVQAAAHIATTIAPKAGEVLKPQKPGAPDPLDVPGGRGAPEEKSPFLEGVKLE